MGIITLLSSCSSSQNLSMLQFNIWQEGSMIPGGFDAIADEIARLEPDFIMLSEVRNYHDTRFCDRIVNALKERGKTYYSFYSYDSGLLSKHPITDSSTIFPIQNDHGTIYKMKTTVGKQVCAVYTAHLDYLNDTYYEVRGYDGNNWHKMEAPLTDVPTILERNNLSLRDDAIRAFIKDAQKEIEEGTIGEIRYIESQFLTSYYDKSNIRLHKENYGGAVYDLGCYNTSMLLKLLEDMPSRVKAMAQYDENGVDIYTAALLNYENDVRASITCGMIFEKDKLHRYDRLYIHGTKGDIKSDTKFNQEGNASYTLIIEGKEQIRNVYCPHNYQLEIEQLGRCIIEGETPVVTADFSIKNAKILDAILQEIGYFESNVM